MTQKISTMLLVLSLCSPVLARVTVDCHGTESGGNGIVDCPAIGAGVRQYAYKLTTDAGTTASHLFIGTEDGNIANYANVCSPQGWDFAIVANTTLQHFPNKTAHGVVSAGPAGNCPFLISWTVGAGAPIAAGGAVFNFGFDHDMKSHDVGWNVDAFPTAWAAAVGLGTGPVHSPTATEFVPAVSDYGLAALLLLTAVAGVIVISRGRRGHYRVTSDLRRDSWFGESRADSTRHP